MTVMVAMDDLPVYWNEGQRIYLGEVCRRPVELHQGSIFWNGCQIDPRHAMEQPDATDGATVCFDFRLIERRRGLNGEVVEYWQATDGDVLRHIETRKRESWWELHQTADEYFKAKYA